MLNKAIILLLSLALVIHFGRGWVLESEEIAVWQNITAWILIYSVAPALTLLIGLMVKGNSKIIRLFVWSVFGVFLAELLETVYWRIPNNEPCANDYFSSFIVSLIIINAIYRLIKIRLLNGRGEGFIVGIGIGYSVAKTIFSKLWWGKLFSAVAKIVAPYFPFIW